MSPQKITNDGDNLVIEWDEDNKSEISLRLLRRECPCASCVVERESQSKDFIRIYNQDQIQIKNIEKVGNYALKLIWKDDHSTGIYEYTLLKKITE